MPWTASEHFRLGVEQDGPKRIVDHAVTLARRAFTLVFEMRDVDFVEVNASFSPLTFELAKARVPFVQLSHVFGQGHGAAEEATNPSRRIFVDEDSFNYWGWQPDVQRCHVHEVRAGITTCKRIIETFDADRVEQSVASALHVVVVATDHGEEDAPERELQRDWLKISFR